MDLLSQIVARAESDKQRIVLPEAEEERTLRAADKALADDIADKNTIFASCKRVVKWGTGHFVMLRNI